MTVTTASARRAVGTVLVVSDDEDLTNQMNSFLIGNGLNAVCATTEQEAKEELSKRNKLLAIFLDMPIASAANLLRFVRKMGIAAYAVVMDSSLSDTVRLPVSDLGIFKTIASTKLSGELMATAEIAVADAAYITQHERTLCQQMKQASEHLRRPIPISETEAVILDRGVKV